MTVLFWALIPLFEYLLDSGCLSNAKMRFVTACFSPESNRPIWEIKNLNLMGWFRVEKQSI